MKYISYKGKLDLIVDKITNKAFEFETGDIKDIDEAIKYILDKHEQARYYGVPIYIGQNKYLLDLVYSLDNAYDQKHEIN